MTILSEKYTIYYNNSHAFLLQNTRWRLVVDSTDCRFFRHSGLLARHPSEGSVRSDSLRRLASRIFPVRFRTSRKDLRRACRTQGRLLGM